MRIVMSVLYFIGIATAFCMFCVYEEPKTPGEASAYLIASIVWPVIIFLCSLFAFLNVIGHTLLFLVGFVSALHIKKDR